MAGKARCALVGAPGDVVPGAAGAIAAVDLPDVRGGLDKRSRELQLAIAQATAAMHSIAGSFGHKDSGWGMITAMLSMMNRRSGSGPTPAPALPPMSTLTR